MIILRLEVYQEFVPKLPQLYRVHWCHLSPHLIKNYEWAIMAWMELEKEDFKPFDAQTRDDIIVADHISRSLISED